jgi:hypothetical protein
MSGQGRENRSDALRILLAIQIHLDAMRQGTSENGVVYATPDTAPIFCEMVVSGKSATITIYDFPVINQLVDILRGRGYPTSQPRVHELHLSWKITVSA